MTTVKQPERRREPEIDTGLLLAGIVSVIVVGAVCWLVAAATTVISSGRPPGLTVVGAVAAAIRLVSHHQWADPRAAYPALTAHRMPTTAVWWLTAGTVLAATTAAMTWAFRRYEPEAARARLARRPGDLRGSRPRAWGRRRDITDSHSNGFLIGRLDGRTIHTPEEAHVALIAPTRAGKTTRYVIPWLLEHDGPAIVTSTKSDILTATHDHRAQHGQVWVFDPFGQASCSWDALQGCEDWSTALRQAHWLAEATQQGDSELAGYWRGEASKLLAPLLNAAAFQKKPRVGTMRDVLDWVDSTNLQPAAKLLAANAAMAAERQLESIRRLDERNRGTTFMSTGSVLAAYRYPQVLKHATTPDLTPQRLLDGRANTLYVIASERHQRLLEPILAALLSSLLNATIERSDTTPRLRVLLDEAANIAPLRDLPRLMSQAAGHGIRIATVWQSLAQAQERYGLGMHTILANSTAKLIMGSTTDDITRNYTHNLLRERDQHDTARELQHLEAGRALYLSATALPAVVTNHPHHNRPRRHRTFRAPKPRAVDAASVK